MAEFTLPANSKPGTGKTVPGAAEAKRLRRFNIYRWNPDDGKNPVIDTLYARPRPVRADGSRRA